MTDDRPPRAARLQEIVQRLGRTLSPEGQELLLAAAQMFDRVDRSAATGISITSVVRHTTGEGAVDVALHGVASQWTVEKTREIAWTLIEAASVAEQEAMLMRFLRDKVGVQPGQASQILNDFRRYREEKPTDALATYRRTDDAPEAPEA